MHAFMPTAFHYAKYYYCFPLFCYSTQLNSTLLLNTNRLEAKQEQRNKKNKKYCVYSVAVPSLSIKILITLKLTHPLQGMYVYNQFSTQIMALS